MKIPISGRMNKCEATDEKWDTTTKKTTGGWEDEIFSGRQVFLHRREEKLLYKWDNYLETKNFSFHVNTPSKSK